MKYDVPAVIFAGGKSSRMGKDKALLPFGDYDSMSEFLFYKLHNIFNAVYISAKTDKFSFQAPLILDRYDEASPLVALISIFETLDIDSFFALSVDTPLVCKEDIEKLILFAKKNGEFNAIVAQTKNGIEPLFGIYKKSILPLAKEMLQENNHKLTSLLKMGKTYELVFQNSTHFANLNHPDEYEKAKAYLVSKA